MWRIPSSECLSTLSVLRLTPLSATGNEPQMLAKNPLYDVHNSDNGCQFLIFRKLGRAVLSHALIELYDLVARFSRSPSKHPVL